MLLIFAKKLTMRKNFHSNEHWSEKMTIFAIENLGEKSQVRQRKAF